MSSTTSRRVDTEPTKNFEGTVTFRSSYYTYDGSKTNFSMGFDYFPSLSNWGRQRLQFDVSLSQDVWKDLSFSIDVFDTFDSDPPDPNAAPQRRRNRDLGRLDLLSQRALLRFAGTTPSRWSSLAISSARPAI